PGTLQRFIWDSEGDLPESLGRVTTNIRLLPESPNPAIAVQCDPGEWTTGLLVIDNSAPTTGSIVETFNNNESEDPSGNALWDVNDSNLLIGDPLVPASPPWGTGVEDLVLQGTQVYTLNTDFGSVFNTTDPGNPVQVLIVNPGSAEGEFHVRSFVQEQGAQVLFLGSAPVVIRCSGDGDPNLVVASIQGGLNLEGQDGEAGTTDQPGAGGLGGPGGGSGGGGGTLEIDPSPPGAVTGVTAATGGGTGGGEGGQSISYALTDTSIPRAGAGGGGGHALPGGDGIITFSPSSIAQAFPGLGGGARGNGPASTLTAGSGGGGGGASAYRQSATVTLSARHGGGGGGGGGALEIIARGSVELLGSIVANGGDGKKGTSGASAGAGGGGSAGSIVVRATGNIQISDSVELKALGGFGGVTSSTGGGTVVTFGGGDGSDGHIRLEADQAINFPGLADFSGLDPQPGSPGISFGMSVGAIDFGTGLDGDLSLAGFPTGSVITTDTNTGELRDPSDNLILTAASGTGELHLTSLNIPEGVTLRGIGDNPLILHVTGEANIAGTVDVSGEAGGMPDYTDPQAPLPGTGGLAGAGGGSGGDGGSASDTAAVDGGAGSMPPTMPPQLIEGAPPLGGGGGGGGPLPEDVATPATGGESVQAGDTCSAGAGGGGGYAVIGEDAATLINPCGTDGAGGSTYGGNFFLVPDPLNPPNSIELLVGGAGGAGGGGHFDPSTLEGAPGSGGGGGGGFFGLSVGGGLFITADAAILARGGDAFMGPQGAGNGGAGAGGAVRIQGGGLVVIESGPTGGPLIDVTGGTPNINPIGMNPGYQANGQLSAGDGGHGRIRIESPLGFTTGGGGLNVAPDPSFGTFASGSSVLSRGLSLPYTTKADGTAVRGAPSQFQAPQLVFGSAPLPPGTMVTVLFEGAKGSLDIPGTPGNFEGMVDDPSLLDGAEFIRVHWLLYGDATTGAVPSVDQLVLPVSF
ncbi:MAG: hypothetical protein ACE5GW_10190, partial [Planctomycetota bacterium]